MLAVLAALAFAVAMTLHCTSAFSAEADATLFTEIGLLLLSLHLAVGWPLVLPRRRPPPDGSAS